MSPFLRWKDRHRRPGDAAEPDLSDASGTNSAPLRSALRQGHSSGSTERRKGPHAFMSSMKNPLTAGKDAVKHRILSAVHRKLSEGLESTYVETFKAKSLTSDRRQPFIIRQAIHEVSDTFWESAHAELERMCARLLGEEGGGEDEEASSAVPLQHELSMSRFDRQESSQYLLGPPQALPEQIVLRDETRVRRPARVISPPPSPPPSRTAQEDTADDAIQLRILSLRCSGLAGQKEKPPDPYAKIKVNGKEFTTGRVKRSLEPEWAQSFQWAGPRVKLVDAPLAVSIWNARRPHKLIGVATIDLSSVDTPEGEWDPRTIEVPLEPCGQLVLTAVWGANLPAKRHGFHPSWGKPKKTEAAPSKEYTGPDGEQQVCVAVELLNASGLPTADSNGLSDPYVILELIGKTQTSKVVKKT